MQENNRLLLQVEQYSICQQPSQAEDLYRDCIPKEGLLFLGRAGISERQEFLW